MLLGKGDGTFQAGVSYTADQEPITVAAADFDGDHQVDLVTSNYVGNDFSVFYGTGAGRFASAVTCPGSANPISVVTGDFNGDGRPDIASSEGNGVSIYLNVSGGARTR